MSLNNQPLIIKLGGAALSCGETLSKLFGAISAYQQQAKRPIVIVHGGGYLVDDLMSKLNLETVKKEKKGYVLPLAESNPSDRRCAGGHSQQITSRSGD